MGIDSSKPDTDAVAVDQAMRIMAAHLAALNAGDDAALAATLHFPHYRLSGGRLKTWSSPDRYLADFRARAGEGWHRSAWDSLDVIAADPAKVHLDVRFTRYREDDTVLGRFRSLWVIAKIDGVWAAQFRSTFAP